MMDYQEETPIYQQLMHLFEEKIKSGEWPDHMKLPDEVTLSQQMNVSRGTLRKAIQPMVEQGLLTQVRGKGTFVQAEHIEQQLASSLISYSEALEQQKKAYITRVLRKEMILPDQKVRSFLNTAPGEKVAAIERVRLIGSQPVIYLWNYVSLALCPDILDEDLEHNRLFDLIENKYRRPILWGQRYFRAVAAQGETAFNLGMESGTPVMYLEQTTYTTGGVPIEYSKVWLDSDRFELMAVLPRKAKG